MKTDRGWERYESAGETVPAFFARPPARAPLPAVVVVHEVWGVDEHIEDVAERFAAAGFEAFAPDLRAIGGERPRALTRERVSELRAFLAANPSAWSGPDGREKGLATRPDSERARLAETLPLLFGSDEGRTARFERFAAILRDGVRHLRARADRPIAAVGFCMGGGLVGLLACAEPTLAAAVAFYGATPPIEKVTSIACPMLGHYADPDPRITPAVAAFAEAMRAAGRRFEHHVYAAPHAFFNDTAPAYRPDAARAAWARTLAFLSETTGPDPRALH